MDTLQIILMSVQIASAVWQFVEPLAAKGVEALVTDLKAKRAAGESMSLDEVKTLADKHGVDMNAALKIAEPTIMKVADEHVDHVAAGRMAFDLFGDIGSFFVDIRNYFADPATAAAIVNIEKIAEAIVCGIAAGAKLALSAEQIAEVSAGTTNEIYAISSLVCTALGGTPTGATATNVTAVTSVG